MWVPKYRSLHLMTLGPRSARFKAIPHSDICRSLIFLLMHLLLFIKIKYGTAHGPWIVLATTECLVNLARARVNPARSQQRTAVLSMITSTQ